MLLILSKYQTFLLMVQLRHILVEECNFQYHVWHKTNLWLQISYQFRRVNRDKWVISSTSAGPTMAFPPQQWLWSTSWELWRDNRGKWWGLWDLSGQATHRDPQWWSTVAQGLGEQVRFWDWSFPNALCWVFGIYHRVSSGCFQTK